MSTFRYHKPGIGNASSYVVSGVPWHTSSVAPALSTTSTVVNLPRVTNYVTVKNTSTTEDVLRFTFNRDNIVDNTNYITLESGESFSAQLRVTDIHLISDTETPVPFSVIAGLTNIDRAEMTPVTPTAPNLLKWVEKQRIEGGIAGDTLGSFGQYGTSLSGDGEILLIGSIYDSTDEINAGSVRVYREIDGTYQQVQELTATTDQSKEQARFGINTLITKDKNMFFIGAYRSSDKSPEAGSTYVFQSSSLGYEQVQIITASGDGDPYLDYFGGNTRHAIAVSDDNNTLIISSRQSDENGTSAGSVYVFRSGSEGYYEAQKLTASGADIDPAGDQFGYSLSISGDAQTIAVGSYGEQDLSNANPNAGAVYIFESGSSGYSQIQKIEDDTMPDDFFGWDLMMTSDGQKLVVASRFDDLPEQQNIGTISVFRRTGNQYILEQRFAGNYTNSGQSITYIAINQDASLIIAGSPQYETGDRNYNTDGYPEWYPNEGAIFVFQSGSSGYELKQTITKNVPVGNNFYSYLGNSIAVNDEGTTFVTSIPKESDVDLGTMIGAAYVFRLTRDY
jgi:hypothetical protein